MSAIKRRKNRIPKTVTFVRVGKYLILPPRTRIRRTFAVWDTTKGYAVGQYNSKAEAVQKAMELNI